MNYEIALINAVLEVDQEEVTSILEQNIQGTFFEHSDMWEYIQEFYFNYNVMPSKDVVKKHYPEFDYLKTESLPVQYYIDEAKKQSLSMQVRKKMKAAADILKESGPNAALNFITSQGLSLMRETGALKDTNLVSDYSDRVDDFKVRSESDKKFFGVPSGVSVIDETFGGWQGGDFIVVLGWTASGKSWTTRMFAVEAWLAGYSPLVISLEMNKEQEGYRFDTILNQGETFKNSDLMFGRGPSADEYGSWAESEFEGKHPFHLVTSDGIESANQNMVEAKIEQYRPDLVILDYHSLFEDANGATGETEKAKNLSQAFKKMAVKYNVPIMDVAAVTMQDGHGERPPMLNEVAWSKQLAFDADLVLAVHRRKDEDIFEIVSRKVRRGNDFAFYLQWDLDTGKRRELFDV